MKKRILILGANGFIGNALVKKLTEKTQNEIFGLDLYSDKLDESLQKRNFMFVRGDINIKSKWIESHIKKCDVIVPLVAIATPNMYVKDPYRIFQLNFESNLKIIKLIAKYNKRVIFPSTSEVYGISKDKLFNEYSTNLSVGPVNKHRWIYSISKQLLDRIIIALAEKKQLEYTIFRPFNWIGPKIDSLKQAELRNGRVLTIFIYNLLYNKDIVLVGNGKQKRSFTYIDDGISALNTIIENKKNNLNGKIFNIGNPKNNISIKKLAEILISDYQLIYPNKYKGKIVYKSEKEFYGKSYEDITLRVPDITEAKKYLNWTPKDDVYSSVSKTLKSFIDANK